MHHPNRIIGLCAALLLLSVDQMAADAADRDQPMNIEADRLEVRDRTSTSTYTGNVKLHQGSLRVQADTIIVRSPENGPETMIMTGNPARFRQLPEGEPDEVHGEARQIEYNVDSEQLILTGEASLWRAKDKFKGERIEYNGTTRQVKAGDPTKKTRVHITIQPRQENR